MNAFDLADYLNNARRSNDEPRSEIAAIAKAVSVAGVNMFSVPLPHLYRIPPMAGPSTLLLATLADLLSYAARYESDYGSRAVYERLYGQLAAELGPYCPLVFEPVSVAGMPVAVDPSLPPNVAEVRGPNGANVRIEDIGVD